MRRNNKKSHHQGYPKPSDSEESKVWYRTPSIMISIFSLLTSTAVGILAIFNSRYIARLDKDIYVPNLQYRVYSSDARGNIIIEITNQGYISAKDLTITIDWYRSVETKNCSSLPPYQNIEPVQPIVDKNLTYRLVSLPIQSSFKVVCTFIFDGGPIMTDSTMGTPYVSSLDLINTPQPNSVPGLDFRGELGLLFSNERVISISNGEEVDLLEIKHPEDIISVNAVAENAKPAIEMGLPTTIWILSNHITVQP